MAKSNSAMRPMSEARGLMAEMKFKQEKRDLRARLKKELDDLTASGVNDLLRVANLRGQLANVESFLAQTDGVQSLSHQAPAMPVNPADEADSTNLYVGSLAPEWTEEMLMREFGRFGDVTSIKIMYPRTELQRMRGMNCGFVQFRTRKQAEAAKGRLNGKEFFGMCLRIDWGKAVQPGGTGGGRPSVQPHLQPHFEAGLLVPPVAAQSTPAATEQAVPERKSRWNKAKTIAVSIPEDWVIRRLIDKTAEFVALEGWDFEQQLLEREGGNPRFSFLKTETQEHLENPWHVYYRWRVFSYAQGDSEQQWRTEPFQVYDNGPLWQPPTCEKKECGAEEEGGPALTMPRFDIIRGPDGVKKRSSGGVGSMDMTDEELCKLDELIAGLTESRSAVLAAMVFCLDSSASSQQISQRISSSIMEAEPELSTAQLHARLFLLSDVLFNSHCTRPGASMYRRQFQEFLPDIFERLGEVCDGMSTLAASAFIEQITRLLRAWSEWSTFPPQFVKGLEATVCCRGHLRANLHDTESVAEGSKPKALQLRLQQWRSTTNIPSLERACRLRGLATKGGSEDLVDRLCSFEVYWQSKEPEPTSAAEAAAAAAAAQWAQLLEEVCDPELDGEALDEEELKDILGLEEADLEAQRAGSDENMLLGGLDLRSLARSGDSLTEVSVENAVATEATASAEPKPESTEAPRDVAAEQQQASDGGSGPEPTLDGGDEPTGDAVEAKRHKARLRQVEKEVLAFQQSLQDAGERPDLIAMKCDRKRMQLLETAARQEAMLDMKARGPSNKAKTPAEPQEPQKEDKEGEKRRQEKQREEKAKKAKKEAGKADKAEKEAKAEAAKTEKERAKKEPEKSKPERARWKPSRSASKAAAASSKRRRSRSRSVARHKDDSGKATGSSSAKEKTGDRRSRSRSRGRRGKRSPSRSKERRRH